MKIPECLANKICRNVLCLLYTASHFSRVRAGNLIVLFCYTVKIQHIKKKCLDLFEMNHFNFLIVRLNNNYPLRIWTKRTFICKMFSFCNISIFQFKQDTLENFQLALFDATSVVLLLLLCGALSLAYRQEYLQNLLLNLEDKILLHCRKHSWK